jgi:hypothetical protein
MEAGVRDGPGLDTWLGVDLEIVMAAELSPIDEVHERSAISKKAPSVQ